MMTLEKLQAMHGMLTGEQPVTESRLQCLVRDVQAALEAGDDCEAVLDRVQVEAERAERALEGMPCTVTGPSAAVAAAACAGMCRVIDACAVLAEALRDGDSTRLAEARACATAGETLLDEAEAAIRELKDAAPLVL